MLERLLPVIRRGLARHLRKLAARLEFGTDTRPDFPTGVGGPPAHWLAFIRRYDPELLDDRGHLRSPPRPAPEQPPVPPMPEVKQAVGPLPKTKAYREAGLETNRTVQRSLPPVAKEAVFRRHVLPIPSETASAKKPGKVPWAEKAANLRPKVLPMSSVPLALPAAHSAQGIPHWQPPLQTGSGERPAGHPLWPARVGQNMDRPQAKTQTGAGDCGQNRAAESGEKPTKKEPEHRYSAGPPCTAPDPLPARRAARRPPEPARGKAPVSQLPGEGSVCKDTRGTAVDPAWRQRGAVQAIPDAVSVRRVGESPAKGAPPIEALSTQRPETPTLPAAEAHRRVTENPWPALPGEAGIPMEKGWPILLSDKEIDAWFAVKEKAGEGPGQPPEQHLLEPEEVVPWSG